jgi:glycine/D-amino acid oxidase-like deaminating enzyme
VKRILKSQNYNKWHVETPRGTVICDVVLHASNAWSGHLLPASIQSALVPTRAQVISFKSPQDEEVDVKQWTRGFSLHDGNEYMLRRRKDGVYVVGGGREGIPGQQRYETDDSIINKDVSKALRAYMSTIFPKLLPSNEGSFQEWTGIMCYTLDSKPIVGQVPGAPGQYVAVGYNGHGMPFGFQSGQRMADQAASQLDLGASDQKAEAFDQPLIQEAWQQYDPNRFHIDVKVESYQPFTYASSIRIRLGNISRTKRHWVLLGLLFLIFAQYAICCK